MTAAARRYEGYVELASESRVSGWAIDLDKPADAVEIVLLIQGCEAARGVTAIERLDVAAARGAHKFAGFELTIEPRFRPFAWSDVAVTPGPGAAPLPFLFQPRSAAPGNGSAVEAPQRFLGFVERIEGTRIGGWAISIDRPNERTVVEVVVDGRVRARATTSLERADVAAAHGSHRHAGFEINLGAQFPIASWRGVMVRPAGAAETLPFLVAPPDVASRSAPAPQPDGTAANAADFDTLQLAIEPFPADERGLSSAPALTSEAPQTPLDAGYFRSQPGRLEGRVVFGPRSAVRLGLHADGAVFEYPIRRAAKPHGFFSIAVPINLNDGQPHEIALCDLDTGQFLTTPGKSRVVAYQAHIAGQIDAVEGCVIRGWASDARQPDTPVTVTLVEHGMPLAAAIANLPRRVAGSAATRGDGFVLHIPRAVFDGSERRLTVLADDGTALNLRGGHEIRRRFAPEDLVTSPDRFRGAIEHVSPEAVTGWALDMHALVQPVTVAILVDGCVEASIVANRYEPRFRPLSGHGRNGFRWEVPARLWNGRARIVEARIVGAEQILSGSPVPLVFPYRIVEPHEFAAPAATALAPPPGHAPGPLPEGMVSLIVLNRDGAALLRAFLASLLAAEIGPPIEVIVIDHGSQDGSKDVAAEFADRLSLRFIARGQNHSYSASNNLGATLARGRFLLFVNNDIMLRGDAIGPMLRHLADPQTGAVGLRLYEPVGDDATAGTLALHHDGVRFRLAYDDATRRAAWTPYEIEQAEADPVAPSGAVPAATAAMLLVRAEDFAAIGGFDEDYFYGLEDVDLCLRIGAGLGKSVIACREAGAIHLRGATRGSRTGTVAGPSPAAAQASENNRRHFDTTLGGPLARAIARAALAGGMAWRRNPCRIGFAVTAVTLDTAAGDVFTAFELGGALAALCGWEICLVPQGETDLRGLDVLVAMRHDFAVRRIVNANPGLVTVAWVRNRVDEWIASGNLDAYGLVFASSRKAVAAIADALQISATHLPIATNPHRFRPDDNGDTETDIVFTGNYWGQAREALDALAPESREAVFAIYGHGWEDAPDRVAQWRGPVGYADLPGLYAKARIVLDDAPGVTGDWHSLNSRVFDAAASGALVITNCAGGAQELLPGTLPSFTTPAELDGLLERFLGDEAARHAAAQRLRAAVLAGHTYAHRAETFVARLRGFAEDSLRFSIKVPIPRAEERETWGDWHFANGLARALRRRGHGVRLDLLPDWHSGLVACDDVVIVLRGLSHYRPSVGPINLLWLISHPEDVSTDELRQYDHVFVASLSHAETLSARAGARVEPLLQCTDPALFFPDDDRPKDLAPVIFVGNSRGVARPAVSHALRAKLDFALYGGGWTDEMAAAHLRSAHIPYDRLRRYYANAAVVLNDHWDDMRRLGFISNRIFDAAAAGGLVVSDDVRDLGRVFGDLVPAFKDYPDFKKIVAQALKAPAVAARRRDALKACVRQHHTFDHRADRILEAARRLLAAPSRRWRAENANSG